METVRLTMAQALVRFLEAQRVEWDGEVWPFVRGVSMLPGHGNVVGLGQALQQEARRLEVYQGKNEQGQAHMAIAFAKRMKRKQIMAVTSSVGPGAANMVTAAATATANNIPVLILPGDVYACRQPDPVLQQIERPHDLSLSTNDAFRPVCRYWDRVVRPEQLMSAMLNAFRVLTDPAGTGAVCLALPQDVEGEAYEWPVSFLAERTWHIERRPPTREAIARAAEAIRAARRPLLICGGGVRYSDAHEMLRAFVERHKIPFAETQAGRGAVNWDHPLSLGGIGVTGCSAANEIAKGADLIIGVGTRWTDFTTASKTLFRPDATFVNVNVSAFHALKMDALSVVADAKLALDALDVALGGYAAQYADGEIEAAIGRWDAEWDRLAGLSFGPGYVPEIADANAASATVYADETGSRLTQTSALAALWRMMDPGDTVIGASGSLPGDMQRMWRARAPDTYDMEYGYSCMGYEVSGALGTKLAVGDDHDVWAMVGDGAFIMLHSELLTAVQERKKIIVCVFDNASFGCINNLQVGQGNASLCTELRMRDPSTGKHDGPFISVGFAAIARAYGAKGLEARTMAELEAAVAEAKAARGTPVVIDIKVLPKSMTNGYGAWWRVGSVETGGTEANRAAWEEHVRNEREARKH